ncbi:MAG: hypothetical protein KDN19_18465 [Verrucomicrobiae bacterium]|nr:hypothetical protein [Verrucomicrobiae bacterium]
MTTIPTSRLDTEKLALRRAGTAALSGLTVTAQASGFRVTTAGYDESGNPQISIANPKVFDGLTDIGVSKASRAFPAFCDILTKKNASSHGRLVLTFGRLVAAAPVTIQGAIGCSDPKDETLTPLEARVLDQFDTTDQFMAEVFEKLGVTSNLDKIIPAYAANLRELAAKSVSSGWFTINQYFDLFSELRPGENLEMPSKHEVSPVAISEKDVQRLWGACPA